MQSFKNSNFKKTAVKPQLQNFKMCNQRDLWWVFPKTFGGAPFWFTTDKHRFTQIIFSNTERFLSFQSVTLHQILHCQWCQPQGSHPALYPLGHP